MSNFTPPPRMKNLTKRESRSGGFGRPYKISSQPRLEPGAAGLEALKLPLCRNLDSEANFLHQRLRRSRTRTSACLAAPTSPAPSSSGPFRCRQRSSGRFKGCFKIPVAGLDQREVKRKELRFKIWPRLSSDTLQKIGRFLSAWQCKDFFHHRIDSYRCHYDQYGSISVG